MQGGKYRIIRTLGQGGFGITYEAEQVLLKRKVALKEFFMKDCCERDESTSNVTVGTGSQKALVAKFKDKFIREAQMMAGMNHPYIVRVIDVFEENGTAYYVMEAHNGGSLKDKVEKEGPMAESQAVKYIKQVADALAYIHSRNTVHLDVKPSNVLLDENGNAILIDFGISKHYDRSGEQTSSTPVGISKGYAPLEQSRDGDVSQFSPATDIYALGATLYYLVSGLTPPEASLIYEDGLSRPRGIPDRLWKTIEKAMQPRRKDRPQDINAFLSLLEDSSILKEPIYDEERTEVKTPIVPSSSYNGRSKKNSKSSSSNPRMTWLWALFAGITAVVVAVVLFVPTRRENTVIAHLPETPSPETQSLEQNNVEDYSASTQQAAPIAKPKDNQPKQESFGSIKVISDPSGATIWLDGKNTGEKTPNTLENLSPGTHSIRMVLDGYIEYKSSVTVSSDQRKVINCKFKVIPVSSETDAIRNSPTSDRSIPTGYVDLGLPSGKLWKDKNESGIFTYDEAKSRFGSYLPSKNDFVELIESCQCSWTGKGYRITGPSGESLYLQAFSGQASESSYLSSTLSLYNRLWLLVVNQNEKGISTDSPDNKACVRLIHR